MTKDIKVPVTEPSEEFENRQDASDGEEIPISNDDQPHDEEVGDPLEQAAALEKKLADTHDRLIRTAAELDNVRKRARRDVEEATLRGRADTLREILPAIDSIDLALKSADPEGSAAAIIDGMEMVRRQFLSATERFGLKPVASKGQPFDPNYHEAVAQVESEESPAGEIVEELRTGYLLGDRLLRAAMVVVSKGPPRPEGAPVGSGSEDADADSDDSDE